MIRLARGIPQWSRARRVAFCGTPRWRRTRCIEIERRGERRGQRDRRERGERGETGVLLYVAPPPRRRDRSDGTHRDDGSGEGSSSWSRATRRRRCIDPPWFLDDARKRPTTTTVAHRKCTCFVSYGEHVPRFLVLRFWRFAPVPRLSPFFFSPLKAFEYRWSLI